MFGRGNRTRGPGVALVVPLHRYIYTRGNTRGARIKFKLCNKAEICNRYGVEQVLHTHSKKSHKCCAAGVPSLNSPSSSVIPCIPAPRRRRPSPCLRRMMMLRESTVGISIIIINVIGGELAPDPACLPATNSVTTHILDALQLLCTVSGYVCTTTL